MSDEACARAVALPRGALFVLLHDCRALVPQLEAAADPEPVSAQAERLPAVALVGTIGRAGPPLMGAACLAQQGRRLDKS